MVAVGAEMRENDEYTPTRGSTSGLSGCNHDAPNSSCVQLQKLFPPILPGLPSTICLINILWGSEFFLFVSVVWVLLDFAFSRWCCARNIVLWKIINRSVDQLFDEVNRIGCYISACLDFPHLRGKNTSFRSPYCFEFSLICMWGDAQCAHICNN